MIIPANKLERGMRMFRIPDRRGKIVPFRLNCSQRKYIKGRTEFDIILKARQEGFSSFLELEGTILCARYPEQHAVVIAHDKESTQKLFKRTKFFLEDVARLGLEIPYKTYTKNEITFTQTNSTFYIGTAGSRKFGRGDTINWLHCSEVGFWPNPVETMSGLIPAAKYGRISLESTANGKGNYFHRECVKALTGATTSMDDGFEEYIRRPALHFYPWHEFDEYKIDMHGNTKLRFTDEEKRLIKDYKLVKGQLAWRRQTLLEMPQVHSSDEAETMFHQEYPMTFDEAFLESGHSLFPVVVLEICRPVVRQKGLTVWKRREQDGVYSMGIDVGDGTRRDYSVFEIVNMRNLEQVVEFAVNDMPPKKFGMKCVEYAKEYDCFVTPEVQHGLIVIDVFKENYKMNKMYKREKADRPKWKEKQELLGFYSTTIPKERIVGKAREAISEDAIIHSTFLKDQLESFISTDDGKQQAEQGCHDDAVIAYCLALEGMSQMRLPVFTEHNFEDREAFAGYTFKAIRDRVLKRRNRTQHL